MYQHEMPGGQYTNLKFQATSLGLGNEWDKICTSYAAANRALGDIVKVRARGEQGPGDQGPGAGAVWRGSWPMGLLPRRLLCWLPVPGARSTPPPRPSLAQPVPTGRHCDACR